MRITYRFEHEKESITNFNIAQSVVELCDEDLNSTGLNAEVVAKMILLQIDARKEGADNG